MLLITLNITVALSDEEIHTLVSGNTKEYFEDKHLNAEILEAVWVAARELPIKPLES